MLRKSVKNEIIDLIKTMLTKVVKCLIYMSYENMYA